MDARARRRELSAARLALACAVLFVFAGRLLAQSPAEAAVQVSAAVQKTPVPKVTLSWPADASTTGFDIYRKSIAAPAWGSPVASLPGTATAWDDTAVSVGILYEYWVSAQKSIVGAGYVVSGIEVPLVESRGKVVLIVDSTYASALTAELSRLEQDLAGDGWVVLRHDVARTETVPNVKVLITADYNADSANVKAVFLFGHVPVPYSGAYAPDDHFTSHFGAWPADLFYGDMDGVWTDVQNFDTTNPGRQHNVAGDGKYDQSVIPSDVELEVGRVDLADMPVLAPKTELDLLRQYLNKDHNFRHGLTRAFGRGLVDDNFGYYGGEMFASSAYRNFAAFFGAANVYDADWFPTLVSQSYLWAYGSGGSANGRYTSAEGVGSTADFGSQDPKAVFTMLFGSWFGDWDTTDNFLRAPLAGTTYGLTDAWAGRPAWYFQHMGMGETVGYGARLTQNNNVLYWNDPDLSFARQIHIALMGDPTLRMHVISPVSGLGATPSGGAVSLNWTASPDAVLGYNVYRAANPLGPFTRVNGALVTSTSFTDTDVASAPVGTYAWAVRAVRLETGSGTYFNASQAQFVSATAGSASATATALSSSSNPATFGQSVTFTATVRSAAGGPYTGTVAFRDGAPTLGTAAVTAAGQASFSTAALGVGSHSITAVYSGDARLATSTSPALTQTISGTTAPVCGGSVAGPNTFNGTALAAGANGIASIALQPGSTNLVISSIVYSGPDSATYVVSTISPCLPGSGTVVVTDFAGNTCTTPLSLAGDPPSATITAPAFVLPAWTGNVASVSNAGPGATYGWTIRSGAITSGIGTPSITFSAYFSGSVVLTVTVTSSNGCSATDFRAVEIVVGEFNGDAKADIVLRNGSTGSNAVWLMNGTTVTSAVLPAPVSDSTWRIVGTGDFDGDGNVDIVWRNSVSGSNAIWFMNGTTLSSTGVLPALDPSWKLGGISDFNGDGKPDLFWRHTSGFAGVWLMDGTVLLGAVSVPFADPQWTLAGVGDFNADGKPDLLWRHSSGVNGVWLMDGTTILGAVSLPSADPQWTLAAVGDYNGDGKPDFVWRHQSLGLNGVWLMNGTTLGSVASLPILTDSNWEIVGPK